MSSLIEQIRNGALWDFPGGVHPTENKQQSLTLPIVSASLPQEIVLPLKQHIGKAGDLLVKVGDRVLKGQPLTRFTSSFMLPIHATTSGAITAIEPRTGSHPSGLPEDCIVITPDGEDKWIEHQGIQNYHKETPDDLIEVIRQAGISGMGGAGFPTARKIQAGIARTDILIINAAECEPYITADDILMQQFADDILTGIDIVEHILKPKLTIIGIEDNKPKAIEALSQAAKDKDIVIRVIPTKYPSGGEKQLIKVLTNKEVPKNKIPADIGVLVQNVGSMFAIKQAVCEGIPLIERVVTLTGATFAQPRNISVRIGTPVASLLDEFGYKADKRSPRLIMGGPMMGFTLPHARVPITKVTNCILAPTRKEIAPERSEMACIRCSQCAEACPASLLPQQLLWHSKAQEYDKLENQNLKDCIECGACAYVCPSEIPLVQYYRQSKAEIRALQLEAEAAERAKMRFEERAARLERDKAERENRFKQAADKRKKEMKSQNGDDAIAAAIARVKAQKEHTPESNDAPKVKPAVAAAIAKAKAKQAAALKEGAKEPDNSDMAQLRAERKEQARQRKMNLEAQNSKDEHQESSRDSRPNASKSDAVAAAIARAKARKAEQAQSDSDESDTAENCANNTEPTSADEAQKPDPKKAAVAAAIARAKARKAAQAQSDSDESDTTDNIATTTEPTTADEAQKPDPKKAAVAAAIARAKARKAAQAQSDSDESDTTENSANNTEPTTADEAQKPDPKKAAVAAAIARAKARKAAQAAIKNHETNATEENK